MKRLALLVALVLAVHALCMFPREARAQAGTQVRVLVSVGSSRGIGNEVPLRHAGDDAANVRDAFVEGGWVSPSNAFVLREVTREMLFAVLDRVKALTAGKRPDDVLFLFYYSGHGTRTELHVGGVAVPLADVAAKISQVPAAFRLVVTDACRTMPGREKGATAEPAFDLKLGAPLEARGTVWLHATADGEAAQESDELGGALFTHHWVQGLRGAADVNGDGNVTLDESYAYAHGQTLLRSSRGSGVYQRPAMQLDLKEAAPVTLTHTRIPRAEIELPRGADTHYLVYGYNTHTIAAEVFGVADRTITVSVPPGRYVVQARRGHGDGATEVRIARAEKRTLLATDFRAYSRELLVQKGGAIPSFPLSLAGSYGGVLGGYAGYGHGGALGLTVLVEGFELGPHATFVLGGEDIGANRSTTTTVGIGSRGAYRFLENAPVQLIVGGGVIGEATWQKLRRLDADVVGAAGYPVETRYRAFGVGGELFVRIERTFADRIFMGLELGGAILGVKTDTIQAFPRANASFVLGARL